jgi:hypothetical protein
MLYKDKLHLKNPADRNVVIDVLKRICPTILLQIERKKMEDVITILEKIHRNDELQEEPVLSKEYWFGMTNFQEEKWSSSKDLFHIGLWAKTCSPDYRFMGTNRNTRFTYADWRENLYLSSYVFLNTDHYFFTRFAGTDVTHKGKEITLFQTLFSEAFDDLILNIAKVVNLD